MSIPTINAYDRYFHQPTQMSNAGIIAGALSIILALFGIFTIGLIFVPLAGICSGIGFLRGIGRRSPVGIGLSLVGGALTLAGFMVSPSLWFLAGVGAIAGAGAIAVASHPSAALTSTPQANQPQVQYASEAADPAFLGWINGLMTYASDVQPKVDAAKSMSHDLMARFQITLGQIKDYKQTYPEFSHSYSPAVSQSASELNNQVSKDRVAEIQLARIKGDWDYKIRSRLDEAAQASTICMTKNDDLRRNTTLSTACSNLLAVSANFRVAAQSAKSAIDDADGVFQAELKASQNIYR